MSIVSEIKLKFDKKKKPTTNKCLMVIYKFLSYLTILMQWIGSGV